MARAAICIDTQGVRQRQSLLELPPRVRILSQELQQRRTLQHVGGRLSSRVLMLERKTQLTQQHSAQQQQPQPADPQQPQANQAEEERKALLQQLMLRLDESFKQHHSEWLPRTQQRGGGKAAKPSLQRPWDPQRRQQQQQQRGRGRGVPSTLTARATSASQESADAPAAPPAAPAVRRSEDLSGVECLYVILRLLRSPGDWQRALRVFQVLNNFGRLADNSEMADRLAAAAAVCKRPEEACAVAESGPFFLSSSVSRPLFFALIEDALDRHDTQLADRLFTCLRQDWRLPISPASYLLMLRAAVTSKTLNLQRCAALYDDALSLGVALPLSAHMLILELLLTRAAALTSASVDGTSKCDGTLAAAAADGAASTDAAAVAESKPAAAEDDGHARADYLRMAERVSVCMVEDSAAFAGRPLPARALLLVAWLSLIKLKSAALLAALLEPSPIPSVACQVRWHQPAKCNRPSQFFLLSSGWWEPMLPATFPPLFPSC
ncbi:hypothetical protein Efla_003320 [Eimeria flavescens]